jgi:hypothetical protein
MLLELGIFPFERGRVFARFVGMSTESIIGQWVEARLAKRHVAMGAGWAPSTVTDWADHLDDLVKAGVPLADAPAGPGAVEFIAASIEDPGWPSSIPPSGP